MNKPPKIRPEWIPEAYRELDKEKEAEKPAAENKPKGDKTPPEPPIKTA
ncbi:hypothetical protein [Mucilaginibacter pedocola]|nr:hypothetical protein [Mucilaginibacter pedocola]